LLPMQENPPPVKADCGGYASREGRLCPRLRAPRFLPRNRVSDCAPFCARECNADSGPKQRKAGHVPRILCLPVV
jgi:hypothetical protein